jgi:hypothetical protein
MATAGIPQTFSRIRRFPLNACSDVPSADFEAFFVFLGKCRVMECWSDEVKRETRSEKSCNRHFLRAERANPGSQQWWNQ